MISPLDGRDAGSRQPHQEVAGEVHAVYLESGAKPDLHVDDRQRDRNAGPAIQDFVQAAVPRILVVIAIADEPLLVEEIRVEASDARERRRVAGFLDVAADAAAGRVAHAVEPGQVGLGVESRVLDLGDDERRLRQPVPGAFEAATSASTRSLRMVIRAQLVERGQRQRAESLDDQLGAVELGRRVAVCHSYTS